MAVSRCRRCQRLAATARTCLTVLAGSVSVPAGKAARQRAAAGSSTSRVPSRHASDTRKPRSSTSESLLTSHAAADAAAAAPASGLCFSVSKLEFGGRSGEAGPSSRKASESSTEMSPSSVDSLLRSGRRGSNLNCRARSCMPVRAWRAGSMFPGSVCARKETKKTLACGCTSLTYLSNSASNLAHSPAAVLAGVFSSSSDTTTNRSISSFPS
mmetsp:Transcript_40705/g.82054  ORF Transcript_40705/g.82054 Transcript_40705/m.82054 type:complete len:213 (+) Transcript_40705:49-687(+)